MRNSGDLLHKWTIELFILRRKIIRLQRREEELENKIGRKKKYVGLTKLYKWKDSKIRLQIIKSNPIVIDPEDLYNVVFKRNDFDMQKHFFKLVTTSVTRVNKLLGSFVVKRIGYRSKKSLIRVITEEIREE